MRFSNRFNFQTILFFVKKLLLFVMFLWVTHVGFSQNSDTENMYFNNYIELSHKLDSELFTNTDSLLENLIILENFAKKSENDTLLGDIYFKYSEFYIYKNPNKYLAAHYNLIASRYYNKNSTTVIVKPYNNITIGNIYYKIQLYEQAFIKYTKKQKQHTKIANRF